MPAQVWWRKWVTDIQPVGSGEAALKYLAAYLCRPPLHESQLVSADAATVTFRYRENTGISKPCIVTHTEFLRRFLQHVPPKGFQRVRYYGWRGAAAKLKWPASSPCWIGAVPPWWPPLRKPHPPVPPVARRCSCSERCPARLQKGGGACEHEWSFKGAGSVLTPRCGHDPQKHR